MVAVHLDNGDFNQNLALASIKIEQYLFNFMMHRLVARNHQRVQAVYGNDVSGYAFTTVAIAR